MELPIELERPSEDLEEVNPDLDMKNNDWAGSLPTSPLSSIEDPKSPDDSNFGNVSHPT